MHPRIHPDNRNGFNTIPDHMPDSHRFQTERTPERLIKWADKVGPNTSEYITRIMQTRPHPEQGFRSDLGILKLGDTFGSKTLEKACMQGLAVKKYSYKSLKIILDNLPDEKESDTEQPLSLHANIRGKEYFNQVVNGGVLNAD